MQPEATWIFFGDDWGRHPSTTQHIAGALAADGAVSVAWFNSIGMREPRLDRSDAKRIASRFMRPTKLEADAPTSLVSVRQPYVLPFHASAVARRVNRQMVTLALRNYASDTVVVYSNPIVAQYLPPRFRTSVYLKLDRYEDLPGVDPQLVAPAEKLALKNALVCACTATRLKSGTRDWLLLPQAVDVKHFRLHEAIPSDSRRTVGFFGAIASWLDFDLIATVASKLPWVNFEFVGPVHAQVPTLPSNVRMLGAVPYAELPQATSHWSVAWIPFVTTELTLGVDPLKAREYLALGLPVVATPLPALQPLSSVSLWDSAAHAATLVEALLQDDSLEKRRARRASIADQTWHARATRLRVATTQASIASAAQSDAHTHREL